MSLYLYADGSRKIKNVPNLLELNFGKKIWSHQVLLMLEVKLKRSSVILIMKVIKRKFIPVARNVTLQLFHIYRILYCFVTKVIEYSQYLHPQIRNCSTFTSAMSNLCLKIVKVFDSKAREIFELTLDSIINSIVDVRHQWKMWQLEHIAVNVHASKWNKK